MTEDASPGLTVARIVDPWVLVAELSVGLEDSRVTFAYPPFGEGTHSAVGRLISRNGLEFPTGDHTVELLYAAVMGPKGDSNASYALEIRNAMPLLLFQTNHWFKEGVYIEQGKTPKGMRNVSDKERLERLLEDATNLPNGIRFSRDQTIRFAPRKSYKDGELDYKEVANDGFIIASCGIGRAKKLSELSLESGNEFRTWLPRIDSEKPYDRTVSSLSYGGSFSEANARIDFRAMRGYADGYAFGVKKSLPKNLI
tara:strand:- start:40 stop:804 length:765 start_codon:yes stop_codon:yes gene_type:complete